MGCDWKGGCLYSGWEKILIFLVVSVTRYGGEQTAKGLRLVGVCLAKCEC